MLKYILYFMTNLIIDKNFYYHPKHMVIEKKVRTAIKYFPKITELEITVNRYRHKMAFTALTNTLKHYRIEFGILEIPSYPALFHELAHVAQYKYHTIPKGEENATIYGVSRMPAKLCDADDMPYYGIIPRDKVGTYAKIAKKRIELGKGDRWLREKVDEFFMKRNHIRSDASYELIEKRKSTEYKKQGEKYKVKGVKYRQKGKILYANGFNDDYVKEKVKKKR